MAQALGNNDPSKRPGMSWLTALLRYIAPPKQTVDPDCKHCRGTSYDASGYTCTCVKELK